METLKEKLNKKIQPKREEVRNLVKDHGDTKVGEIHLRQLYSGMRGMLSMITETSKLDPHDGIKFRGYSLDELLGLLPKSKNGEQALPEGIFYLMLINPC